MSTTGGKNVIQVTDKYAINTMPECYAVAVKVSKPDKEAKYVGRYFYGSFEEALIKISTLIEKDALQGSITLQQAVDRVSALHLEMREYIKEACRNYAYRDDN